ncbi:MAG: hypothetical protein K2O97_11845 [Acetatifactor sp.]|nr:hypothetical protein [Acetatifactor sp.]
MLYDRNSSVICLHCYVWSEMLERASHFVCAVGDGMMRNLNVKADKGYYK